MNSQLKLHVIIIAMIYALLFYVTCILDQKLVHIGFFSVPAPFLYFTFIYPLSNAVTEVYGPANTWKFLISGYLLTVVFSLLTIGMIHMPNPSGVKYITIQDDYDLLDSAILGCLGFGYLAFFTGMFVNVKLLAKYKLKFPKQNFYSRSIKASLLSELIVTVMANVLIWGPRMPFPELMKLIAFGYLFLIPMTFFWVLIGTFVKNTLYICEEKKQYSYNTLLWNVLRTKDKK